MSLVLDASVALAWCVPDESNSGARRVAAAVLREGAFVPALWRWEVGNALIVAERRGRIRRERVAEVLERLVALPIAVDELPQKATFGAEIELARRFAGSVYDAAYLELALRRGLRLATNDAALAKAAQALDILFALE